MPAKKKPADERRSHPYQIRLTEAEFKTLDARARALDLNLSDLIRKSVAVGLGVCSKCLKPLGKEATTDHESCP